jgi:hypothetical protein
MVLCWDFYRNIWKQHCQTDFLMFMVKILRDNLCPDMTDVTFSYDDTLRIIVQHLLHTKDHISYVYRNYKLKNNEFCTDCFNSIKK